MPTDFRGTVGGDGVVLANAFQTALGVSEPKTVVNTSITFDPPSLATSVGAVSTGITVTGAAVGDSVDLYPPYDTDGVIYQASVSAANTIKISLFNANSITKDLASGTWGVVVNRRL